MLFKIAMPVSTGSACYVLYFIKKMKNHIKIAVIGGSGKSGKYLVEELLNKGFQFKLLLRNPDKLQVEHQAVEIVKGDVATYDSVRQLVEGCNAVISTLGLGIPASEPTIFTQSSRNVIRAMAECNIKRYIVTTGLNVNSPFDRKGEASSLATNWMKTNFPASTENKQEEYQILYDSKVDWTLVRLPLIELSQEKGDISLSLEDCPGERIRARDLASFLVEQLFDERYIRSAPFIASV